MTCCIGYKANNMLYFVGDTQGSIEDVKETRLDPKVFECNHMLFATSGSFRMRDVLMYELKVPNRLQKRVYDDFQELKYLGGKELSDVEIRKLNSLKGRIQASRNIEEGKFPEINRLTNLIG